MTFSFAPLYYWNYLKEIVSFTSLILPGIEIGGVIPVLVGIVVGALVLGAWVPHVHVLITGRVRDDEARDTHEKSGLQHRRIAPKSPA